MSQAIIERLRRNREFKVEVGAHEFIVRRPTDLEFAELQIGKSGTSRAMIGFVVGWSRVTEMDVLGSGGGPEQVQFSKEIAEAWLEDRPDLLVPLLKEVSERYAEHVAKQEDAAKK